MLAKSEKNEARPHPRGIRRRGRWKATTLTRNGVQLAFAVFLLYTGWVFQRFVQHFETGGTAAYVDRPAAVDAFLPLSALVSLKSWWGTGVFDQVHPAGLAILLAIILVSILFKKGFCGWICPIGALSEGLARFGRWSLGRNLRMPATLDWPLRGIKYLLLAFFVEAILVSMSPREATLFLQSPYNKVADVKMLQFFTSPGPEVLAFLIALAGLSMLFSNFWCRYLCPYGALLGIASLISPLKVTRNSGLCTDCGRCTRACPNRIEVARLNRVVSPECTACLSCVEACPRRGALAVALPVARPGSISPRTFAVLMLALFFALLLVAQISGHWQSAVAYEEYAELIPRAGQFSH